MLIVQWCKYCGIELYDGTRVCPKCKAKKREETKSPYDKPKYKFDGNTKLDKEVVKAYKAGMSYGIYKMRLDQLKRGEITQEQFDEMIERKKR